MIDVKVFFRSTAGGVDYRKIYNAKLESKGETTKIFYEEMDENGLTRTQICVVGSDFVTVKREGQFSNYLEFRNGYAYSGEYLTPYGKVPVEAFTKNLTVEYVGDIPQITAKYKSSLMGEVTENEFCIKIRRDL